MISKLTLYIRQDNLLLEIDSYYGDNDELTAIAQARLLQNDNYVAIMVDYEAVAASIVSV